MSRADLAARLAFLTLAAAPALASAQADEPRARYRQSAAVLARYGDVALPLQTPALAPGRTRFTTDAEMHALLRALDAASPHMTLGSLGRSAQGRDLPFALFTAEGLSDPAAVLALGRPVVWLIGQQHGNEPAGGEALLALSAALADGPLTPLLDRVTVVVVPRANPDGAAAAQRRTSDGLDLNRDHLLASLPETRALHAKAAQLPPDLVVDLHEYAAAGPWLATFGVLAPWDAMFMAATHPSVPASLTRLAERRFRPAMEQKLAAEGLTSHTFLASPGGEAEDSVVPTGGAAPGISRNYFGLTGAVSLLVETRGADAGREGLQRRIATHYLASAAALETAAREATTLRRTVAEARRGLAADRADLAVGFEIGARPAVLTFIDSLTGADRPVHVSLRDSRDAAVTARRPRPAGYLLTSGAAPAVAALRAKGLRLCAAGADPVTVEAYRVRGAYLGGRVAREGINPEAMVSVTLEPLRLTPPPGSVYVPMDQPGAAVAAASLEPDAPGSHVAAGLAVVSREGLAPIYRTAAGALSCPAEILAE